MTNTILVENKRKQYLRKGTIKEVAMKVMEELEEKSYNVRLEHQPYGINIVNETGAIMYYISEVEV